MSKEYKPCECGHHFVKNGKRKGIQKYICKKCGANFTDSERKVGRPCLFEKPLTGAERAARNRAKAKAQLFPITTLAHTSHHS